MNKNKKTVIIIAVAAVLLIIAIAATVLIIKSIKNRNADNTSSVQDELEWISVDVSNDARIEIFEYAYNNRKIYMHVKLNRYVGTDSIYMMSVIKENNDGTEKFIETKKVKEHFFGTTVEDEFYSSIPAEQEFSYSIRNDLEKDENTKAYRISMVITEHRYLNPNHGQWPPYEQTDYTGEPDQSQIILKIPVD